MLRNSGLQVLGVVLRFKFLGFSSLQSFSFSSAFKPFSLLRQMDCRSRRAARP